MKLGNIRPSIMILAQLQNELQILEKYPGKNNLSVEINLDNKLLYVNIIRIEGLQVTIE